MANRTAKKAAKKKSANRQVSLRDIAEDLNVSLSLVSKVISGKLGTTKVREEVKDAILSRVQELNYRPNSLASALQSGRTGTIGVIVHPTGVRGSGLFDDFLRGLTSVLEQHNLRLWLRYFEDNGSFYPQWHKYSAREVDGLIVAGVHHEEMDEFLLKLVDDKLPVVTCFAQGKIRKIPNVNSDSDETCYLATKTLIDNGCENIAYIDSFELRKRGYLDALKDNGLTYRRSLVYATDKNFEPELGAECVASLIENKTPFDGLVVQSDPMAFSAVQELQRHGLRVPEDVQVIGFDNSPICDLCSPKLTSVSGNMHLTGVQAVETLIKLIEERPVEPVVTPSLIVERESTRKQ